jgi:Bacterial PH domain
VGSGDYPALRGADRRLHVPGIEADGEGLHLVNPFRTVTYRWDDIAEIRPSIAKGKRTYLVMVRRNRQILDLPITEEHLDELRRWHKSAT